MEVNWFVDLIRTLFFWFDHIIYRFIDLVYQLFMMIAETGIFSAETLREFSGRIYFFLGLIMLFKVSISIVQYIANPDSVKDSKIGAPKLLKNIVIILLGIILVPYVFEAAYSLQRIVLKDNIIGNLILGMKYQEGESAEDYIKTAGKRMAFTTFTAFFHLNTDIELNDEQLFSSGCAATPYLSTGEINTADCSEEAVNQLRSFANPDNKKTRKNLNYIEAYKNNDINSIRRANYNYKIKDKNDDKQYMFDYIILASTLAGGFIVYILLGFCVDIAIRSVKLGFLQLIAPVPLIAKIDPKKGDDVFNRWVKQCISTYFDLFGRLIAIYFAVFLLSIITDGFVDVVDGTKKDVDLFVFVFFIIGILNFAKALPKLLGELIPGLKLGDGKGLGLKNKLAGTPLVGGAANKALGLAGRTGKNLALGGAHLAGLGLKKGAGATGLSAWAGNDKRWYNRLAASAKNNNGKLHKLGAGAARVGNAINSATGNAFSNIGVDAASTFSGMGASLLNNVGMLESRKNQILNRQAAGKMEMDRNKKLADSISAMENRALDRIKSGAGGQLSMRYNKEMANITKLKNMTSAEWTASGNAGTQEDAIAQAQYNLDQWLNSNEDWGATSQYIDTVLSASKDQDGNAIPGKYREAVYNADGSVARDANNKVIYQEDRVSCTATDGTLKDGLYGVYSSQARANGRPTEASGSTIHDELAYAKKSNNEIRERQAKGNNEIAKIDEQIRTAREFNSKK